MNCEQKASFTISPGIKKVIEAFDKGRIDSLIPKMGKTAVDILKKWWHWGRMTGVRITGDIWSPCGKHSILAQASKADINQNKRVLDIACGIGGPGRILARHYGCRIIGVDIDSESIEVAKALTKLEGLENFMSFEVGDRIHLPYDDHSFNVVWGHGGWGLNDDFRQTWREAARVVKIGGQVISYGEPELLNYFVELGFPEIRFFSYYREERRNNLQHFLQALKENRDEIISRTNKKNYEEWYRQKSQQLKNTMLPTFHKGIFLAIK